MKSLRKIILSLFIVISVFTFAKEDSSSSIRFGSPASGYITVPANWYEFNDPNTSATAKQVTIDSANIITLDIVSTNGKATAKRAAEVIVQKYLNLGTSEDNIFQGNVNINGYDGEQVAIEYEDGSVLIMYFIEADGNIYYIAQEGEKEHQKQLAGVIKTWSPRR